MRSKNDRIQTVWWSVPISSCVCLLSCSIIVCKCFKIKSLVFPMCLTLWKQQPDKPLLIHPDNLSTLFSLLREPALTCLFFLMSFPPVLFLFRPLHFKQTKRFAKSFLGFSALCHWTPSGRTWPAGLWLLIKGLAPALQLMSQQLLRLSHSQTSPPGLFKQVWLSTTYWLDIGSNLSQSHLGFNDL